MSNKDCERSAHVSQRLNLLKKQQDKWVEERSHALSEEKKKKGYNIQGLPKKHSSSKTDSQKRRSVDKKSDTLLWASSCSNIEYSGFVVRKGLCTPDGKVNRSRPGSATSDNTNKSTSLTGKSRTSSVNKDKVASASKKTGEERKNETLKVPIMDGFPEVNSYSITSEDTTYKDLTPKINKYTSALSIDTFKDIDTDFDSLDCFGVDSSYISMNKKRFNDVMSNHLCPLCEELMVDNHTPQIVIPCGHSFCSVCISEEKYCPSCRNKIVSIEENDTMLKIIVQFQMKKEEDEKKKKEAQSQKYVDEYQLLDTRTNAMKEEAAYIIENMEKITLELVEKKKTIKTIVGKGGDIQKQIENLHETLMSLEMKCNEESDAVRTLEDEYESYKKQLIMTEKTLKTLTQSKERVKVIVGNLLPSLDLGE